MNEDKNKILPHQTVQDSADASPEDAERQIVPGDNAESEKEQMELQLHQSFIGPLPPPEILKKFDEVVPGSAERIIKLAEAQFAHRTEIEKKVIESDISRSKWGQILGFCIAMVGLIGSFIVSTHGNQWTGGIIGVGTLVSLVSVFMYGVRTRDKERKEKDSDSEEVGE